MKMQSTPLMRILLKNDKPILVFQGGTGSSKTYTILQYLILKCLSEWKGKTIDIVRRTFPSLRISVMKDFFDILISLGQYKRENHNKSESTYNLNGNIIRFYSSDEEQKVRGPRRHITYFNEILEFKKMDVMQILMRTHEFVFMDYNPSEEFHWIYDDILTRKDVNFNKSSYKDNPFLTTRTVSEIERLKNIDENLWRIYGLGEKGVTQATIFTNWDYTKKNFEDFEGQVFYGLDFGYNDPVALTRIKYHEKEIFAEELIYKTGLTSDMIVRELENLEKEGKITKESSIYADSARPEIIEEIKRAGFNIYPAPKEKDSVLRGINFIKKHKVWIQENSVNFAKELRTYKWKLDKDDRIIDIPVDLNDHLCLSEGTLITTNLGQKPIEEIKEGDLVLTRKGFKEVLQSNLTNKNAELYKAEFNDGRFLIGTGNHPIFTDKGFIRLDALSYIYKPLDALSYIWQLGLREKDIIKEKMGIGEESVEGFIYTEMFGNLITEKYQKDNTYITKMGINQIIKLRILSVFHHLNILKNIGPRKEQKKTKSISKKLTISQRNGINQKKEEYGTQNMPRKYGNRESHLLKDAKYVWWNMKILQEGAIRNTAQTNVNQRHLELKTLKKLKHTGKVYNLKIKDNPEYFANGILTHNCDSFRYGLTPVSTKIGNYEILTGSNDVFG